MAIVLNKLSKSYDGRSVLKDFSAVLPERGVVEIIGRSGSGKTTLLRLLMGLEKPDGGSIEGLAGRRLGAVFQEDRLLSQLSAVDNVRFACEASEETVLSHLAEVGLPPERARERVRKYSGGMKRRVAIVRAVLYPCDVLILDEPFKGMDEETRAQVMRYILRCSAERLTLLVSHDRTEGRAMHATARLEIGGEEHDGHIAAD